MAGKAKSRSLPPGFSFSAGACSLELEGFFWAQGLERVAGIDEAGRGPLAGSVVAAAVILPGDFRHAQLTDSKKLTARQRESIYAELTGREDILWAAAEATPEEIDQINILRATHLAMRRAAEGLRASLDMCLIDGLPVTGFPWPHTAVVKGDALCASIAAASVIAKVHRDRQMEAAHAAHPGYGFAQHKGYGTAAHLAALQALGPCQLHRRSFAPVGQRQLELDFG